MGSPYWVGSWSVVGTADGKISFASDKLLEQVAEANR